MRADTDFQPFLTERLLLRRSVPADAERIWAYRSDPEVGRYQGWPSMDVDSITRELEEMANRAPGEPGGWVQLTVEDRATGELVGDVGVAAVEGEPGAVTIGYTITPAVQGRGYGTEAVTALIRYAFERLGADVVRAYAHGDNHPSIRLAEKAGMRLVDRSERRHGEARYFVVRYETRRPDPELLG